MRDDPILWCVNRNNLLDLALLYQLLDLLAGNTQGGKTLFCRADQALVAGLERGDQFILRADQQGRIDIEQELAFLYPVAFRIHREFFDPAFGAQMNMADLRLVVIDIANGIDAAPEMTALGLRRAHAQVLHHFRGNGHGAAALLILAFVHRNQIHTHG